jgi:hypothetical protein
MATNSSDGGLLNVRYLYSPESDRRGALASDLVVELLMAIAERLRPFNPLPITMRPELSKVMKSRQQPSSGKENVFSC